jgi:hypothetical protein
MNNIFIAYNEMLANRIRERLANLPGRENETDAGIYESVFIRWKLACYS